MSDKKIPLQKLDQLKKSVIKMTDDELHYLLDTVWYNKANNALAAQRKIWDYSYLAYKGIMLDNEVNRKRSSNGFGMYVNVPRTFATIEAIRKNFNINQLKISIEKQIDIAPEKIYKASKFINYDLDRSGTRKQIKDAGFNKLLYGNGFLYSYLMDRGGKYYNITGKVDKKTGRVEVTRDTKRQSKYYGMVARSINPYKVLPDPDGSHLDVNNGMDRLCSFACIRTMKHISAFRRDWSGIIPEEILDAVEPGGKDMTNYEVVKDAIDHMFNMDAVGSTSNITNYLSGSNVKVDYSNTDQMVEERLWLGEDFLIVQAGKGMKICLVSPNPNPNKRYNLVKMDDVVVPGEFWAMGQPYILRYQQIEENRLHNSVLDLVHFAVSGMVGVQKNYLEDPTDLEIYPEKVWAFKAIPNVKIGDVLSNFQPSPAAIPYALNFLKTVKEDGQQATSITDFVMGASKSIADTATESNRLAGASDITIVDKIREMVAGAMIDTCYNWFSMYPVVYKGEKIKLAYEGENLYFIGKSLKNTSEKELTKLYIDYKEEDVIFTDDFDINTPKFKIVGDIEVSKDIKFRQWVSAIDFAKGINEVAYNTGDPRRLDTIKMGQDAMANFDVISDPTEYIMDGQTTKMDEIAFQGEMNKNGINGDQEENGGAPKKNNINQPKTDTQEMKSKAQPKKK